MATSQLELKPVRCGCGGEAKITILHWDIIEDYDDPTYLVECENCEISTKDYATEAEAIEAWNTAMGTVNIKIVKDTAFREWSKSDDEYLCSECGHVVSKFENYCSGCGARLEWNE